MSWLYENPETLDYGNVDEPIRGLVKAINQSSWLRTEESCCGHPANEVSGWGNAKILYIRFVVKDAVRIPMLLEFVDLVRASYGLMIGWHVALFYDRKDGLGTHWYFNFEYASDIANRVIAVDIVLRSFIQVSIQVSALEGSK